MLPAPPLFNVNYFINPPLAPFACNNSLYVSLLCPVFCVLHPVSCFASDFAPCASRSYLLCPLIIAQNPLVLPHRVAYVSCCTFSVITTSDILSPSNSESRSHVSCPALRPASCFASDYALCSLCSYLHVLYLLPLCLPCATSCTVPHFSVTTLVYPAVWQFQSLRLSFSPLQPRI